MNTTMKKECIIKKIQVNKLFFIILISIVVSVSCNKQSSGFVLQNFEISNHKLDSVTLLYTKHYVDIENDKKKVIVLEFLIKDSLPEFWFSMHGKDELRDYYIFHYNSRIIGYITRNNCQIILLSRINFKDQFEASFYKFIYPTEKKERINYLFFPDNQYLMSEEIEIPGRGQVKISRWPVVPVPHTYSYYKLKYINNKFIDSRHDSVTYP